MIKPWSSSLSSWNIHNQDVILRADLNIDAHQRPNGNHIKLTRLLPTLNFLLEHNASITLITHIGRPKNKQNQNLSTRNLVPIFKQHGYKVLYASTIDYACAMRKDQPNNVIILLENVRFWNEETKPNMEFAKKLAQLGTFYCNDAFGTLHRYETSLSLLPRLFNKKHKTIGFLIEQEMKLLYDALKKPKRPFLVIVGGKKAKTKISYIASLVNFVDQIILLPAIAFNFLKSQGIDIQNSLVEKNVDPLCSKIIAEAQQKNVMLMLPRDVQITFNEDFSPPYQMVNVEEMPPDAIGISLGETSLSLCKPYIKKAGTIIVNGPSGFFEHPLSLDTTIPLFREIAKSKAKSIAIGGDTLSLLSRTNMLDDIDITSTGGGAALAYITNQPLPALDAL